MSHDQEREVGKKSSCDSRVYVLDLGRIKKWVVYKSTIIRAI
jgi:hypothetical protein